MGSRESAAVIPVFSTDCFNQDCIEDLDIEQAIELLGKDLFSLFDMTSTVKAGCSCLP